MNVLGLIPARGGSKGVPRKNIKNLCGKPLIQYTIDSALESKAFSQIIVSTEDEEIAEYAAKLGVPCPFLRPQELAGDKSPTIDSVAYTLDKLQSMGQGIDAVCLLQPTNPLRSADIIKQSIEQFIQSQADSLISVRSVPHEFNPHWTFEEGDKNSKFLKISTGEKEIISRRQDLPPAFYRDGSIYITKSSVILEQKSLYGEKISYINLDEQQHVNIDTMEDWYKAERLLCAE